MEKSSYTSLINHTTDMGESFTYTHLKDSEMPVSVTPSEKDMWIPKPMAEYLWKWVSYASAGCVAMFWALVIAGEGVLNAWLTSIGTTAGFGFTMWGIALLVTCKSGFEIDAEKEMDEMLENVKFQLDKWND